MEPTPRRLLCQVREAIRLKHYSIRTEQAYFGWLKRYICFNGERRSASAGCSVRPLPLSAASSID